MSMEVKCKVYFENYKVEHHTQQRVLEAVVWFLHFSIMLSIEDQPPILVPERIQLYRNSQTCDMRPPHGTTESGLL